MNQLSFFLVVAANLCSSGVSLVSHKLIQLPVRPPAALVNRSTSSSITTCNASNNNQKHGELLTLPRKEKKRSAAGYARKAQVMNTQRELDRAQEFRTAMAASLGLSAASLERQKQEIKQQILNDPTLNTNITPEPKVIIDYAVETETATKSEKRPRGRPPKNKVGSATATVRKSPTTSKRTLNVKGPKRRGPGRPRKNETIMTQTPSIDMISESSSQRSSVQRNEPSDNSPIETGRDYAQPTSVNGKALQKYYDTELLSAEQEKEYGNLVQYMMRCEEVYSGLRLMLDRNPTIVEWAGACGYCANDDSFEETDELHNRSRPADEDDEEEEGARKKNGNGIYFQGSVTSGTGVGRGKGRVKKAPRACMEKILREEKVRRKDLSDYYIPINGSGTPTAFVAVLDKAKIAKKEMVKCNMRLVISIARRYQSVGVNIQDLVQEGSLGLIRATEKYDPSKGFKFSTYASWWIQQATFRAIAYHSRTIRLPVHVHNMLNKARKVRNEMMSELGRAPTEDELALKLGMPVDKLSKMLKLTRRSISLEEPKYSQNPKDQSQASELSIADSFESGTTMQGEDAPEDTVDQSLFHRDLNNMLKILGEDERRVIRMRYGLDDGMTRTVTSVAQILRVSKSWVRSQECRALRKLRRPWYEKKLKEHQHSLTS